MWNSFPKMLRLADYALPPGSSSFAAWHNAVPRPDCHRHGQYFVSIFVPLLHPAQVSLFSASSPTPSRQRTDTSRLRVFSARLEWVNVCVAHSLAIRSDTSCFEGCAVEACRPLECYSAFSHIAENIARPQLKQTPLALEMNCTSHITSGNLFSVCPHQMKLEEEIFGWSDGKTAYRCADRVEVRVKRQKTVRFVERE